MLQFIISIITAPFRLLRAIYNRFGPGGLLVFFGIILIIFLGYKFISNRNARIADLSKPPTIQEAPYIIQTSSRVYYVRSYHQEGSTIVLDKYYGQEGYQWKFYETPMPLTKAFGNVLPPEKRNQ